MTNARFISSVRDAAKHDLPQMPWTRGTRRRMFIAKRAAELDMRQSA